MVRWLGQRDEFRCGPIALVNILKWAGIKEFEGHRVNEKLAKGYLTARCWTDKDGTNEITFLALLRNIPELAVTWQRRPVTRWDIKWCLKSGGIILLEAPWWNSKKREFEWHYSLIVETTAGGACYIIVNHYTGQSTSVVTGRGLAKALAHPCSQAYFIWKDTK
jgi:hypothetical protein